MKVLVAGLVISLATTCLATCMPCTYYHLSLVVVGDQNLQEQISTQSDRSITLLCTISKGSINQGRILINGSTPSQSTKRSTITASIHITQALAGVVLWCEANFSTSCGVCISDKIQLNLTGFVTTETSLNTDPSEENGEDDKTDVKENTTTSTVNMTISTFVNTAISTFVNIAARFPIENLLSAIIVPVFFVILVGVLVIAPILCCICIKRRKPKRKTQSPVLPLYGRNCNLNSDQDNIQHRDVTYPLLQPPKETPSDSGTESKSVGAATSTGTESKSVGAATSTGTESESVGAATSTGTESKSVGTATNTDTERHGTEVKELCSAGSAVNGGACQNEDADNVLEIAAGQAGNSLDDEGPLQDKSTAKDKVDSSQDSNATQKETSSQNELVLNGANSEPTVCPQDELTADKFDLAIPQAQMSGPTKSDLPNSRRVIPRTPRGSAADRSCTDQSTQIPHGTSGTSSPEDSGSSGVEKSDGNSSAGSNGMGPIAEMELPIIDTSTSIAEQIITSDQNVCNSFSSTTGN